MNQEIADALLALQDENGSLDPQAVVDEARSNKQSPLHNEFQWDIKTAANEHWLSVARRIIRDFKVIIKVRNTTRRIAIKAFVHDPERTSGYRSTAEMKNNPAVIAKALLADCRSARTYLQNSFNLAEYWEFEADELGQALVYLENFITKLEQGDGTMMRKSKRNRKSNTKTEQTTQGEA